MGEPKKVDVKQLRAQLSGLIDELERKLIQGEDFEASWRQVQFMAYARGIERAEELHALQMRFWTNVNKLFFWRG